MQVSLVRVHCSNLSTQKSGGDDKPTIFSPWLSNSVPRKRLPKSVFPRLANVASEPRGSHMSDDRRTAATTISLTTLLAMCSVTGEMRLQRFFSSADPRHLLQS